MRITHQPCTDNTIAASTSTQTCQSKSAVKEWQSSTGTQGSFCYSSALAGIDTVDEDSVSAHHVPSPPVGATVVHPPPLHPAHLHSLDTVDAEALAGVCGHVTESLNMTSPSLSVAPVNSNTIPTTATTACNNYSDSTTTDADMTALSDPRTEPGSNAVMSKSHPVSCDANPQHTSNAGNNQGTMASVSRRLRGCGSSRSDSDNDQAGNVRWMGDSYTPRHMGGVGAHVRHSDSPLRTHSPWHNYLHLLLLNLGVYFACFDGTPASLKRLHIAACGAASSSSTSRTASSFRTPSRHVAVFDVPWFAVARAMAEKALQASSVYLPIALGERCDVYASRTAVSDECLRELRRQFTDGLCGPVLRRALDAPCSGAGSMPLLHCSPSPHHSHRSRNRGDSHDSPCGSGSHGRGYTTLDRGGLSSSSLGSNPMTALYARVEQLTCTAMDSWMRSGGCAVQAGGANTAGHEKKLEVDGAEGGCGGLVQSVEDLHAVLLADVDVWVCAFYPFWRFMTKSHHDKNASLTSLTSFVWDDWASVRALMANHASSDARATGDRYTHSADAARDHPTRHSRSSDDNDADNNHFNHNKSKSSNHTYINTDCHDGVTTKHSDRDSDVARKTHHGKSPPNHRRGDGSLRRSDSHSGSSIGSEEQITYAPPTCYTMVDAGGLHKRSSHDDHHHLHHHHGGDDESVQPLPDGRALLHHMAHLIFYLYDSLIHENNMTNDWGEKRGVVVPRAWLRRLANWATEIQRLLQAIPLDSPEQHKQNQQKHTQKQMRLPMYKIKHQNNGSAHGECDFLYCNPYSIDHDVCYDTDRDAMNGEDGRGGGLREMGIIPHLPQPPGPVDTFHCVRVNADHPAQHYLEQHHSYSSPPVAGMRAALATTIRNTHASSRADSSPGVHSVDSSLPSPPVGPSLHDEKFHLPQSPHANGAGLSRAGPTERDESAAGDGGGGAVAATTVHERSRNTNEGSASERVCLLADAERDDTLIEIDVVPELLFDAFTHIFGTGPKYATYGAFTQRAALEAALRPTFLTVDVNFCRLVHESDGSVSEDNVIVAVEEVLLHSTLPELLRRAVSLLDDADEDEAKSPSAGEDELMPAKERRRWGVAVTDGRFMRILVKECGGVYLQHPFAVHGPIESFTISSLAASLGAPAPVAQSSDNSSAPRGDTDPSTSRQTNTSVTSAASMDALPQPTERLCETVSSSSSSSSLPVLSVEHRSMLCWNTDSYYYQLHQQHTLTLELRLYSESEIHHGIHSDGASKTCSQSTLHSHCMQHSQQRGVDYESDRHDNSAGVLVAHTATPMLVTDAMLTRLGVSGLINLGNTCYMNSSLQCLSNLTTFRRALLGVALSHYPHAPATAALLEVVGRLWSGQLRYVATHDLKSVLGSRERRYAGFQQQDASEFLDALLDCVHEELNRVSVRMYRERHDGDTAVPARELAEVYWSDFLKNNRSLVPELFFHQSKTTFHCLSCGMDRVVFDNNLTLSVNIKEAPTRCVVHVIVIVRMPVSSTSKASDTNISNATCKNDIRNSGGNEHRDDCGDDASNAVGRSAAYRRNAVVRDTPPTNSFIVPLTVRVRAEVVTQQGGGDSGSHRRRGKHANYALADDSSEGVTRIACRSGVAVVAKEDVKTAVRSALLRSHAVRTAVLTRQTRTRGELGSDSEDEQQQQRQQMQNKSKSSTLPTFSRISQYTRMANVHKRSIEPSMNDTYAAETAPTIRHGPFGEGSSSASATEDGFRTESNRPDKHDSTHKNYVDDKTSAAAVTLPHPIDASSTKPPPAQPHSQELSTLLLPPPPPSYQSASSFSVSSSAKLRLNSANTTNQPAQSIASEPAHDATATRTNSANTTTPSPHSMGSTLVVDVHIPMISSSGVTYATATVTPKTKQQLYDAQQTVVREPVTQSPPSRSAQSNVCASSSATQVTTSNTIQIHSAPDGGNTTTDMHASDASAVGLRVFYFLRGSKHRMSDTTGLFVYADDLPTSHMLQWMSAVLRREEVESEMASQAGGSEQRHAEQSRADAHDTQSNNQFYSNNNNYIRGDRICHPMGSTRDNSNDGNSSSNRSSSSSTASDNTNTNSDDACPGRSRPIVDQHPQHISINITASAATGTSVSYDLPSNHDAAARSGADHPHAAAVCGTASHPSCARETPLCDFILTRARHLAQQLLRPLYSESEMARCVHRTPVSAQSLSMTHTEPVTSRLSDIDAYSGDATDAAFPTAAVMGVATRTTATDSSSSSSSSTNTSFDMAHQYAPSAAAAVTVGPEQDTHVSSPPPHVRVHMTLPRAPLSSCAMVDVEASRQSYCSGSACVSEGHSKEEMSCDGAACRAHHASRDFQKQQHSREAAMHSSIQSRRDSSRPLGSSNLNNSRGDSSGNSSHSSHSRSSGGVGVSLGGGGGGHNAFGHGESNDAYDDRLNRPAGDAEVQHDCGDASLYALLLLQGSTTATGGASSSASSHSSSLSLYMESDYGTEGEPPPPGQQRGLGIASLPLSTSCGTGDGAATTSGNTTRGDGSHTDLSSPSWRNTLLNLISRLSPVAYVYIDYDDAVYQPRYDIFAARVVAANKRSNTTAYSFAMSGNSGNYTCPYICKRDNLSSSSSSDSSSESDDDEAENVRSAAGLGRNGMDHYLSTTHAASGGAGAYGKAKAARNNLESCLASLMQPDILRGEDAWYCPRCKTFQEARVQRSLFRLPPCVIIALKRFRMHSSGADKNDTLVKFPDELDFGPYLDVDAERAVNRTQYRLRSIIYHSGSLSFGHYTAAAYNDVIGRWVHYNDTNASVASANMTTPPPKGAYVLCYEQSSAFTAKNSLAAVSEARL